MSSMEPQLDRTERTRMSYDMLAGEYATRLYGELSAKPFDRERLECLAEQVRFQTPVCDLGCGRARSPATSGTAARALSVWISPWATYARRAGLIPVLILSRATCWPCRLLTRAWAELRPS